MLEKHLCNLGSTRYKHLYTVSHMHPTAHLHSPFMQGQLKADKKQVVRQCLHSLSLSASFSKWTHSYLLKSTTP